jgi:hypothetical protein
MTYTLPTVLCTPLCRYLEYSLATSPQHWVFCITVKLCNTPSTACSKVVCMQHLACRPFTRNNFSICAAVGSQGGGGILLHLNGCMWLTYIPYNKLVLCSSETTPPPLRTGLLQIWCVSVAKQVFRVADTDSDSRGA